MNRSSAIKPTNLFKLNTQHRLLSTTQISLGKNFGFDKKKIDNEENLMENAPKWKENNATESEADVKADKEPNIDPELLKEETAEWIASHKDSQGNIKK